MDLLTSINDAIWNPMAYFALAVGLFFTVMTGWVQFRRFPDMIRQILSKKNCPDGISPAQALLLTLASRVGVGNIAGVATAIAAGGPGALLWMIICALLGSASSYAETVLAQVFKRRINGEHRGGMPFYIEHGLKLKWLAVTVSLIAMLGYGFVFPGVQSNNIASSVETAFNIPPLVSAIGITALMAFVIIGGTKRIVGAAQIMVPVMAVGYIVAALVIVVANYDQIVPTIALIVSSAFGTHQVFGGIVGAAVAWGVRRAVFSNVAGVGEGTYGAAAASVSHPSKQGLVQAFSIYIDTVVVCFATGLMIVMTGSYNVFAADGTALVEGVPGLAAGAAYTQQAISTVMPGVGPGFVAVALFFFAFTTLVAFFYIAKTNLVYLTGKDDNPVLDWALKLGMLGITFYGGIVSADVMWAAGDIGYGTLGWINMLCLLALSAVVYKVTSDYDKQCKAGLDPVFDPTKLGIAGADFWVEEASEIAANQAELTAKSGRRE
ncbi:alanine/glycine:cation symporter family protein [Paeniglutamicibacter psychrophenolicus]|uniref:AGCS family alanine or glycine:cation symporter n=1 Tax=Paeniglutamicibacter psychrophenolicus TaxID=257454 RepID=A0ABS4WAV1_9MICC|nr:alanine/glycine:cation symporter family protein [Paeniglutamicibacter psychrophenolicus]MBP2373043.1 AGCS family alanine or glycine:cation symporter [Paeniglutamicibacter psychrophenolicus]